MYGITFEGICDDGALHWSYSYAQAQFLLHLKYSILKNIKVHNPHLCCPLDKFSDARQ